MFFAALFIVFAVCFANVALGVLAVCKGVVIAVLHPTQVAFPKGDVHIKTRIELVHGRAADRGCTGYYDTIAA